MSSNLKADCDLIETIIKLGCSVNETDVYSRTPLHYAREEAYELLLNKHDVDETIKDCDENTPVGPRFETAATEREVCFRKCI